MPGQLQTVHNTRPPARLPPFSKGMDDLTTGRSFDSQATCTQVIDMIGSFFEMLSMGVCTTRHWQTSSRLVQELNVCTVAVHACATFLNF